MASASAPAPSSQQASLLSKTLASARSLVLLQLLSRALTFSLNYALLRLASPEVFGTASIQFDLIGSTLLFLSREGVRGALLRSGRPSAEPSTDGRPADRQVDREQAVRLRARRQQDLNLSLLPLPLFLGLVAVIVPLYVRYSPATTVAQPFFYASLGLHLLAYLLELLSEPYHIRLQSDLRLGVRVQAEGAAVIAKAVGTLCGVWLMRERGALLGFGVGQLAYSIVLLGRFAAAFGLKAWQMWLPNKGAGTSSCAFVCPLAALNGRFLTL
jgi:oligosaccharide translocation protein RFT1